MLRSLLFGLSIRAGRQLGGHAAELGSAALSTASSRISPTASIYKQRNYALARNQSASFVAVLKSKSTSLAGSLTLNALWLYDASVSLLFFLMLGLALSLFLESISGRTLVLGGCHQQEQLLWPADIDDILHDLPGRYEMHTTECLENQDAPEHTPMQAFATRCRSPSPNLHLSQGLGRTWTISPMTSNTSLPARHASCACKSESVITLSQSPTVHDAAPKAHFRPNWCGLHFSEPDTRDSLDVALDVSSIEKRTHPLSQGPLELSCESSLESKQHCDVLSCPETDTILQGVAIPDPLAALKLSLVDATASSSHPALLQSHTILTCAQPTGNPDASLRPPCQVERDRRPMGLELSLNDIYGKTAHCKDQEKLASLPLCDKGSSAFVIPGERPATNSEDLVTRYLVTSEVEAETGCSRPASQSLACAERSPTAVLGPMRSRENTPPASGSKRSLVLRRGDYDEDEPESKRQKSLPDARADAQAGNEDCAPTPPASCVKQDTLQESVRLSKRPLLLPSQIGSPYSPHKRLRVDTPVKSEPPRDGPSVLSRLSSKEPLEAPCQPPAAVDLVSAHIQLDARQTVKSGRRIPPENAPFPVRIEDVVTTRGDGQKFSLPPNEWGWDWPFEHIRISRGGARRSAQLRRQRAERELAALLLRYPGGVPDRLLALVRRQHPGVGDHVFDKVPTVKERRRFPQAAIDSIYAAIALNDGLRPGSSSHPIAFAQARAAARVGLYSSRAGQLTDSHGSTGDRH